MAAPTVNSVGPVVGTPGGSNINAVITAPATIGVDDILVLTCLTNSTHFLTTLASGWAHVTGSPVSSTNGTNDATLNVCWKRAVAGDVGASSYTFTLNAADYAEGAIVAVRSANNSGNPWGTGAEGPQFAHTSAATTTAPAVSLTTQGADRLLWNGAINQTGGSGWTASSGFTKDFDTTGGGSFSTCTGYHKAQAVGGATGNVQPVCPASGEMVNFLGALLPVGAGGTTYTPPTKARRAQPTMRIQRRITTIPPAQVFVAQPRRRRPTPTLVRRGRVAQVVPPQVVVVAPPQPPQFIREKTRWFASRRGKAAQVVPPQVVVPPPPIPPQLVREKLRWFATRRGRVAQMVPPQVVAPPPVYVPPAVRSRGRFLPARRPRVTTMPPPHQHRPPTPVRARPRLPVIRRGRVAGVIPPQIAVTPPYRPRNVAQKLRQLVFRRPRFVGSGWLVGSAAAPIRAGRMTSGTSSGGPASGAINDMTSGSSSTGEASKTAAAGFGSTSSSGGPVSDA